MLAALCGLAVVGLSPPAARFGATLNRRGAVCGWCAAAGAAVLPARSIWAADLKPVVDKEFGVTFDVPEAWSVSESELSGGRKLLIATDPSDADYNAFIAFTPIAGDYSALGSFGNLESVGATLLPQCSSGFCTLQADNIEGKMLDAAVFKGSYVYDYLISATGSPQRHLRSLFSIKTEPNRATSTLVTLTAQCLESKHSSAASTLKAVCESFKYL